MKIAILSDAHDHADHLRQVLAQIASLGAETLLFCGDFCAPPMAKIMSSFNGPLHIVFGNNDGDRFMIAKLIGQGANVTLHGEHADIVINGKKIGMTHYPFYAEKMAKSGDFDLVCFGHDHQARIDQYGKALAINPGCLNAFTAEQTVGFAIYDTATHTAQLHSLTN